MAEADKAAFGKDDSQERQEAYEKFWELCSTERKDEFNAFVRQNVLLNLAETDPHDGLNALGKILLQLRQGNFPETYDMMSKLLHHKDYRDTFFNLNSFRANPETVNFPYNKAGSARNILNAKKEQEVISASIYDMFIDVVKQVENGDVPMKARYLQSGASNLSRYVWQRRSVQKGIATLLGLTMIASAFGYAFNFPGMIERRRDNKAVK